MGRAKKVFVVENHQRGETLRKCIQRIPLTGDVQDVWKPQSCIDPQFLNIQIKIDQDLLVRERRNEFGIEKKDVGRFIGCKRRQNFLLVLATRIGLIQDIDVRMQSLELCQSLLIER